MKRTFKLLSICACFLLVVSAMLALGIFANAEESVLIKTDSVMVERGKEVTVTVYAEEGSDLARLNTTFEYNDWLVTYVKSSGVATVTQEGNLLNLTYNSDKNATGKLELAKLTFAVDEQIESATHQNWLKRVKTANDVCKGANESNLVDWTLKTEFGAISVRKIGDVYNNNDGKVNARDASRILQHVARISAIPDDELVYANVYEDYNADGSPKINARDASVILQYVARIKKDVEPLVHITFFDEFGNKIVGKSVKAGEKVNDYPTYSDKMGKTFCWSKSVDEKIEYDLNNVTESVSLYPYYVKDEYTLSFNTDGGNKLDDITVSYGVRYVLPVPVKTGYVFSGWVCGDVVIANEGFWGKIGNQTLTAVWAKAGESTGTESFTFGYITTGGGGYFGNAEGADLTGGKTLTMEFNLDKASFGSANYNNGIIVGDHLFTINDPYGVGTGTFYWHSNWAYFDQRHCWAQGGASIGSLESAGAVFDRDLLFDTLNIFKAGNSIRIVYTSYTDSEGGSIKVYTKATSEGTDAYTLRAQVTNIPKENCPNEEAVYLAWYMGGSPVPNYTGAFSKYKVYSSDGTEYLRINVGPNMTIDKVSAVGAEEPMTAVYNLTYTGEGKTFYSWFGSENGVNMNNGDTLTMSFEIIESSYPYGNYNVGFVLNGIGSNGSSNPCTADSSHGSFFYGNPAFGADNMVLKLSGSGTAGAVVTGDFNPQPVMMRGNTVKVIYTYKDTGSTFEVYTRYKLDPDGYWKLVSKATNLTNTPKDNVHIYWYTDSSQRQASDFGAKIKNYEIVASNGTRVGKNFASQATTFSTVVESDADRLMILSGTGKQTNSGYVHGGATWYGNIDWTKADSMSFKVVKGEDFKIVLNGGRADVDKDTVMLTANSIDYLYYDVEFDANYAYLYGKQTENGARTMIDKVGLALDKFSVGIRVESKTSKANVLYLDDVIMNVAGDKFIMNFDGGMPTGTSIYGNGQACVFEEDFVVTFVTYDGEILETQNVSYGKNATLPNGDWANADEVMQKISFVDNDLWIYLEREGDNVGGFYVSVEDGTLSQATTFGNTFGVYAKPTTITVIAREPVGSSEIWMGWSDGEKILSTDKEFTLTVRANTTLKAIFDLTYCEINVVGGTLSDGGTSNNFDKNSSVTVIARDAEYSYEEWIGWSDGEKIVSTDKTYTFSANRNVTLTAVYNIKSFKVVVVNGFIRGENVSEMEIKGGTSITVAANSSGGTCKGWMIDGVKVSSKTRYTFTVTEDVILTPIFA